MSAGEVFAADCTVDHQGCPSHQSRLLSALVAGHADKDISLSEVSLDWTGCSIGAESPTAIQPKESTVLSRFEQNGHKFLVTWQE